MYSSFYVFCWCLVFHYIVFHYYVASVISADVLTTVVAHQYHFVWFVLTRKFVTWSYCDDVIFVLFFQCVYSTTARFEPNEILTNKVLQVWKIAKCTVAVNFFQLWHVSDFKQSSAIFLLVFSLLRRQWKLTTWGKSSAHVLWSPKHLFFKLLHYLTD